MATHSSIVAWEIPWTERLAGYSPWGHRRVRYDLATKQHQQVYLSRTPDLSLPSLSPLVTIGLFSVSVKLTPLSLPSSI